MQEQNSSGMPTPHEGQTKILELPGRFKVAVCGRRFGKTVAAAIAAVTRCEKIKDTRVWWISPVQEQSQRVEREVAFWLRDRLKTRGAQKDDAESEPTWQHRISDHALQYSNGSRIEFHSAETRERLRGAGLDLIVIDEAADVDEYTWNVVLKPMLLERHGDAILTGTPRGKNHWLHRIFLLGQAGDSEQGAGYASIQLPTTANPDISAHSLKDYRAEMTPEMYRQEFEAEFIDGVGTLFAGSKECITSEILKCGRPGVKYVTGIDLGQSVDFTVLCSISCTDKKLEGFARFNQMDWRVQEKGILEHLKLFPGPAVVDATGAGSRVWEALDDAHREKVERFIFTAQSRTEILTDLQRAISYQQIQIAQVTELIAELDAFSLVRDSDGGLRSKMVVPSGMHDDCVMALSLAWHGMLDTKLWEKDTLPESFAPEGFWAELASAMCFA